MSTEVLAQALPEFTHACPYLPGRTASYERYHLLKCDEQAYAVLLAHGYRRFGAELFRPGCPGVPDSLWCGACVPLRLPVATFRASRSQRKVWRRGQDVRVEVGEPVYRPEKFELYRRHKQRFRRTTEALDLPVEETVDPGSEEAFVWSFYSGWPHGLEFTYHLDDRLVGIGFVDHAVDATSSVYFCFDEAFADLSPGTLSMLHELAYAREQGVAHHYLGYVVHDNPSMAYKARFRPSEVYDGRRWLPHRNADGSWAQRDPAAFRQGPPVRILHAPSG